jgi:hypothetical protein
MAPKGSVDRAARADAICSAIREAFAGVRLGGGVGLREGQALDDYADAATRGVYRANDEKEDWERISAEELRQCHSSLSFFDAEGMRFHLPRFLVADLRGEYSFGLSFTLTNLSDYTRAQLAALSAEQRRSVRMYLLHLLDDPDEAFDRERIEEALRSFWAEPGAP